VGAERNDPGVEHRDRGQERDRHFNAGHSTATAGTGPLATGRAGDGGSSNDRARERRPGGRRRGMCHRHRHHFGQGGAARHVSGRRGASTAPA
jgi:hypothetical protein